MPRPKRYYPLSDRPNDKGFWEITWAEGTRSRRHSTRETERAAAELYRANWLLELERGQEEKARAPEIETPTVAQVMEAYLIGHVADCDLPQTIKDQTSAVRHIQAADLGKRLATEITPEDVKLYGRARGRGWVGWLEGKKRRGFRKAGAAAFRNEMLYLNAALRWCVGNRKFTGLTLATLIPVKPPAPPEARKHYFTIAQADALLAAAKARSPNGFHRLYLFILIELDTAARKDTVEKLPWKQVKLYRDDTGSWQGEIDFQDPGRRKTRKRRGVNYLSSKTATILADAREAATTPYVLGHTGTVAFSFRRLAKNVTGYETGPHIMRHSWATWAVSNGVPLVEVAGVLHDTVETVSRVYGKLLPEKKMAAVNFVAGLRDAVNDQGEGAAEGLSYQ